MEVGYRHCSGGCFTVTGIGYLVVSLFHVWLVVGLFHVWRYLSL